jgi:hypothetical protein
MKFSCHENQAMSGWVTAMKALSIIAITAFAFLALTNFSSAQDSQNDRFVLSSTTFENGATLPISTIYNYSSPNICSIDGSAGGDESPQLSWRNAPRRTRSFVLIAFDVTGGFMHWGMYNISSKTTELPENAGVAGSSYGPQVLNAYGDLSYDGPCPPSYTPPNDHEYVFTVYALDTADLKLPSYANFPTTALTLFRAMVAAGRDGHILASASLTSFYSTTP